MNGLSSPNSVDRNAFRQAGDGKSTVSGDVQKRKLEKVFHKLCTMSDSMEEIENWLDSRTEVEAGAPVTLENLDLHLAAELKRSEG